MLLQNMPLWYKDYFALKQLGKKKKKADKKNCLPSPSLPRRVRQLLITRDDARFLSAQGWQHQWNLQNKPC